MDPGAVGDIKDKMSIAFGASIVSAAGNITATVANFVQKDEEQFKKKMEKKEIVLGDASPCPAFDELIKSYLIDKKPVTEDSLKDIQDCGDLKDETKRQYVLDNFKELEEMAKDIMGEKNYEFTRDSVNSVECDKVINSLSGQLMGPSLGLSLTNIQACAISRQILPHNTAVENQMAREQNWIAKKYNECGTHTINGRTVDYRSCDADPPSGVEKNTTTRPCCKENTASVPQTRTEERQNRIDCERRGHEWVDIDGSGHYICNTSPARNEHSVNSSGMPAATSIEALSSTSQILLDD
jgi:hypothetical protein